MTTEQLPALEAIDEVAGAQELPDPSVSELAAAQGEPVELPASREAPPPQPPVSLQAYAELRGLKHWQLAALRTKCPVEQHMRHGRGEEAAHAEYLAHTGQHSKPASEWDELLRALVHSPVGRVL